MSTRVGTHLTRSQLLAFVSFESGAILTIVCIRKGVWAYVVSLASDWLVRLNRAPILFCGDAGRSLMSLLSAIRDKVVSSGVLCEIEKGVVGSHQSRLENKGLCFLDGIEVCGLV